MRAAAVALLLIACDSEVSSDMKQQQAQEVILAEGTSQTGMPAIKNFRERKLLKEILELRDQTGLVTYTYLYVEMTGKKVFLCDSIGYGIPYATEYTSPQKLEHPYSGTVTAMPQADPNGLFAPSVAEGTWVMCKDPHGGDVRPVYIEPRIIVSPFKLDDEEPAAPPPSDTANKATKGK